MNYATEWQRGFVMGGIVFGIVLPWVSFGIRVAIAAYFDRRRHSNSAIQNCGCGLQFWSDGAVTWERPHNSDSRNND